MRKIKMNRNKCTRVSRALIFASEWNSPLKVAHPPGYVYPYYRRSYEWVANERNRKTLY